MRKTLLSLALATALGAMAEDATVTIDVTRPGAKINREIYGQFAEHLGTCVYGGLWVGPDSKIPNTDGYRNDMLRALKDLRVPVLRWPGGCFADEYHWRDGIGPRSQRPTMSNNNWGGTVEDNSFGTHEFLNLCELLGCEPYVSGNVGSGTVEEMQRWVEYMTSDGDTPMARLRRQNGREKPWHVKYLGVGNESWGCGGNMRVEYYADLFRRYATYCRDYDGNQLYRVASGSNAGDVHWTQVLMDQVGHRMGGCSLHFYTVTTWNGSKGQATKFTGEDYYWTLGKCLNIEPCIEAHDKVMTASDPEKKIGLLVDEWGTWWDVEPGTNPGHLYQQNTMRDAFVAALTLNVFHRHADRVKMANIAQIANVLQSMILTDQKDGGHLVLTPTYHVFRMYTPFQEATSLPTCVRCDTMTVRCDYEKPLSPANTNPLPVVAASSAKAKDGSLVVSLANVLLDKAQTVQISLNGMTPKLATGTILTSSKIDDYNDFSHPATVTPQAFSGARIKKGQLIVTLPAKSIVVLTVK